MSEIKYTPRLLVVSNSCFSNNTSNGRTLRNFLVGWEPDKIAQFYIQNEEPDFTVCHNFYRVTDGQALRAFFKGVKVGGKVECSSDKETAAINNASTKKHRRNSFSMLLRELVWSTGRWKSDDFKEWLDSCSPEVILLQSGDSPFMLKFASDISKKRNIPLVIYNSEVYYFKKFDYFRSKGIPHLLYPVFHSYYKYIFKKTIRRAEGSVYNCEMIKEKYDKEFNLPSKVIYTATQAEYINKTKTSDKFVVSYLGNLGVGRHEGLIEIGKALQNISPEHKLDVYGKIPNDTVKVAFENCKGINYKGFISYEQVLDVMSDSDLLVHVENFSDFYRKDLQYAFSTKIADSLAMGVGFLLYAPQEVACSKYLKDNEAAFVVNNKDELFKTLKALTENPEECRRYSQTAHELAERNHNFTNNANEFQNVLKAVVSKNK